MASIMRESLRTTGFGGDEAETPRDAFLEKKTFTRWVNHQLSRGGFEPISDLFADLADGEALIKLVNVTCKIPMPRYHVNRKGRAFHLDNVSAAFRMLAEAGADKFTGSLKPEHITDGDEKRILGLIWSIVCFFAEETILARFDGEPGSAIRLMSNWATLHTSSPIKNFHLDFENGVHFLEIIAQKRPDLVDVATLDGAAAEDNVTRAIKMAEDVFSVPHIIDVEDMLSNTHDEKIILIYLTEIVHAYNGLDGLVYERPPVDAAPAPKKIRKNPVKERAPVVEPVPEVITLKPIPVVVEEEEEPVEEEPVEEPVEEIVEEIVEEEPIEEEIVEEEPIEEVVVEEEVLEEVAVEEVVAAHADEWVSDARNSKLPMTADDLVDIFKAFQVGFHLVRKTSGVFGRTVKHLVKVTANLELTELYIEGKSDHHTLHYMDIRSISVTQKKASGVVMRSKDAEFRFRAPDLYTRDLFAECIRHFVHKNSRFVVAPQYEPAIGFITSGAVMLRNKDGRAEARYFWFSKSCDRLLWAATAEARDQDQVLGFIPTVSIEAVRLPSKSSALPDNSFLLQVKGTGEVVLQAETEVIMDHWLDGLKCMGVPGLSRMDRIQLNTRVSVETSDASTTEDIALKKLLYGLVVKVNQEWGYVRLDKCMSSFSFTSANYFAKAHISEFVSHVNSGKYKISVHFFEKESILFECGSATNRYYLGAGLDAAARMNNADLFEESLVELYDAVDHSRVFHVELDRKVPTAVTLSLSFSGDKLLILRADSEDIYQTISIACIAGVVFGRRQAPLALTLICGHHHWQRTIGFGAKEDLLTWVDILARANRQIVDLGDASFQEFAATKLEVLSAKALHRRQSSRSVLGSSNPPALQKREASQSRMKLNRANSEMLANKFTLLVPQQRSRALHPEDLREDVRALTAGFRVTRLRPNSKTDAEAFDRAPVTVSASSAFDALFLTAEADATTAKLDLQLFEGAIKDGARRLTLVWNKEKITLEAKDVLERERLNDCVYALVASNEAFPAPEDLAGDFAAVAQGTVSGAGGPFYWMSASCDRVLWRAADAPADAPPQGFLATAAIHRVELSYMDPTLPEHSFALHTDDGAAPVRIVAPDSATKQTWLNVLRYLGVPGAGAHATMDEGDELDALDFEARVDASEAGARALAQHGVAKVVAGVRVLRHGTAETPEFGVLAVSSDLASVLFKDQATPFTEFAGLQSGTIPQLDGDLQIGLKFADGQVFLLQTASKLDRDYIEAAFASLAAYYAPARSEEVAAAAAQSSDTDSQIRRMTGKTSAFVSMGMSPSLDRVVIRQDGVPAPVMIALDDMAAVVPRESSLAIVHGAGLHRELLEFSSPNLASYWMGVFSAAGVPIKE